MARLCRIAMVTALAWLSGWGTLCPPVMGRDAVLKIHPQKLAEKTDRYLLLPAPASLAEGDALVLYQQAADAVPRDPEIDQIRKWIELPVGQLPQPQAEAMLEKHMGTLRHMVKATRCRACQWPEDPEKDPLKDRLAKCRKLASMVDLWARLEIARGEYDGALLALQTGFAMSRHLSQGPTLIHALVAMGIHNLMCQEIEELVQGTDPPNLYFALAGLPRPFIDIEKAMANEMAGLRAIADEAQRQQAEAQNKPGYDRTRIMAKAVDADLAALQCVEAIRAHAASQGGRLPNALSEVTEVPVPPDPVSGKPFRYARTGSTAVLESAIPPGGNEKHRVRYEIVVKN